MDQHRQQSFIASPMQIIVTPEEVAAAVKARVARWIESNRDKHRNHQMKSELAKRLQCSPSDIPQDFIELKRAHINLQTELAKLK